MHCSDKESGPKFFQNGDLDNISLYRGAKLMASRMVGLDDLPITSSESEFTASSGGEDVYELYE